MDQPVTRAPWQAPRTAYLLTAAAADRDQQAADRLWDALGEAEQAGVLAALGAQCRAALLAATTGTIAGDAEAITADITDLAAEVCREAIAGLRAVLSGRPWTAPPCPHCRKAIAVTLTGLAVGAGRRQGISAEVIAHNCRRTADRVPAA